MTVDDLLTEARSVLTRVTPQQADELRRAGAMLVDMRPRHNRLVEGEIPGSVAIERIVLEWRLDPRGAHRIDGVAGDTPIVVLCNEGYASSLAARDLRRLGLSRATDLIGGFRAWAREGLPVREGATEAIT